MQGRRLALQLNRLPLTTTSTSSSTPGQTHPPKGRASAIDAHRTSRVRLVSGVCSPGRDMVLIMNYTNASLPWRLDCRRTLTWIILLGSAITTGCGGKTHGDGAPSGDSGSGSSSGGSSEAGASDSANANWSLVCPDSVPTVDTPCTQDQLQCEYGDAWWNVSCDTTVQCIGGQWITDQPSTSPCLPAPEPNPPSCPQNPTAIGHTSCPQLNVECVYGQGVFCTCDSNDPDGGNPYWGCLPEPGCPASRPRLGAPCTGGQVCTYESCVYTQQCVDGVWQGGDVIHC